MNDALPQESLSPFSHTMGELVKGEVRTIAADSPAQDAARIMNENGIGSLVVLDGSEPVGIITKTDLVNRVLLPALECTLPVREILTPSPVAIDRDRSIFDGLLLMIRHGIGHLLVTEEGRLMGVVSERDWLTFQERHPAAMLRLLDSAGTFEDLAALRKKMNRQVSELFRDEGTASALTRFVTEINDRVSRRVIELSLESLSPEAGAPPVPFAWISMGSEGRAEQTLATDQDNGLVFKDVPGEDLERVRAWFLQLAARVVDGLEICGFPRCKGNIMASNPELCLPLRDWRRKFAGFIAATDEHALISASILFDFRCLYGEPSLVDALWSGLLRDMRNNKGFLRHLALQALEGTPPVNTLHWRLSRLFGLSPPRLDLKKQALAPLVGSVRVLALAAGVSHTNTLERLEEAGAAGVLPDGLARAAVAAYEFLMLLRIRQHFQQQQNREAASNMLETRTLNPLHRAFLNDALVTVIELQNHVYQQYGGVPLY